MIDSRELAKIDETEQADEPLISELFPDPDEAAEIIRLIEQDHPQVVGAAADRMEALINIHAARVDERVERALDGSAAYERRMYAARWMTFGMPGGLYMAATAQMRAEQYKAVYREQAAKDKAAGIELPDTPQVSFLRKGLATLRARKNHD